MPAAFFLVGGVGFYTTFGVQWNAWIQNLPNIIIYTVICLALSWVLKKKEDLTNKRENSQNTND